MDEIRCPVCTAPVAVRATRSARGKAALMLACPRDGRHFRAFINDAAFVAGVLVRLEEADEGTAGVSGGRPHGSRGSARGRAGPRRTVTAMLPPAASPRPRRPARPRR